MNHPKDNKGVLLLVTRYAPNRVKTKANHLANTPRQH